MRAQRPKSHNLLVGTAGEYRVASEIMLRGHTVFEPAVDITGADIITDEGIRIQVKTSNLISIGKYPYYVFRLSEKISMKNGKRVYGTRPKKLSEEVDFLICWGIDENRFWIVPAKVADNLKMVNVAPRITHPKAVSNKQIRSNSFSAVLPFEGQWDLLFKPEVKAEAQPSNVLPFASSL